MAVAMKEKTSEVDEQGIREAIARMDKNFQTLEKARTVLEGFDWKAMRVDLVQLLNSRESLSKLKKQAELDIAAAEREAQIRLASVESGHRTMIERLELREIEVSRKQAEMERRELAVAQERQRFDLLNAELERKIAGVDRVTAKK